MQRPLDKPENFSQREMKWDFWNNKLLHKWPKRKREGKPLLYFILVHQVTPEILVVKAHPFPWRQAIQLHLCKPQCLNLGRDSVLRASSSVLWDPATTQRPCLGNWVKLIAATSQLWKVYFLSIAMTLLRPQRHSNFIPSPPNYLMLQLSNPCPFILLKVIEAHKKALFMWVLPINIYPIKN